jgi:hypothetical protein
MLKIPVSKSSRGRILGLIAVVVIGIILLPMSSSSIAGAGNTQKHSRVYSEANIIVPGVRVGDYKLGMSKDDVLKKLGEPKSITHRRKGYDIYFDGICFNIVDNSVNEITVLSTLYKFANGLGVGDSEQKIKQAFGNDFTLKETQWKDFLIFENEGLQFEIHKKNRKVMEIAVYQTTGERGGNDAPSAGKVIIQSEQSPGPITFPKIDRRPKPEVWEPREMRALAKYNPDSTNPFQVDLRSYDLSKLDLSNSIDNLLYATFDDGTVWPASEQMPSDFSWQKIMEIGKNPGLGIRSLHKKGIIGRGVGVAIIDQPLLVDHQEYAERLRLYEEIHIRSGTEPQMHGPAVASIAVGKTVGVAPEAELYYIAQFNFDWQGTRTLKYLAEGIHRIVEINEQLPQDKKIRVISISKGWGPTDKDYKEITKAARKARAKGMLVVCTSVEEVHKGCDFGGLGRSPLADPDVFESYEPGLFLAKHFYEGRFSQAKGYFWVPMDSRTTASPGDSDEYVFYRQGGFSWAVPYIAGVYALAVQVDDKITPRRFWTLAVKTGRIIKLEHKGEIRSFGPILDPVKLINELQKTRRDISY